MIVLPNSFERYLAGLRKFLLLSILKRGLQPNHLQKLKKIYKAEAIYHKNLSQSVDIYRLCENLLGAVATIKPDFKFKCNADGNFIINKNLFTCFLLMSTEGGYTKIFLKSQFLLVYFFEKRDDLSPFVISLGGILLKELTTDYCLAIIPLASTTEESVYIESEWDYLFDKFSAVNVFLAE